MGLLNRRRRDIPNDHLSGHQSRSEGDNEVAKNGHGRVPFESLAVLASCNVIAEVTVA